MCCSENSAAVGNARGLITWLDRITDPFFEPTAFFRKYWQSTWIVVCCCALYVIAVFVFNGVTNEMRLAAGLEAGEITQSSLRFGRLTAFFTAVSYLFGPPIFCCICWFGVAAELSRAKRPMEEHSLTKVFFVLMWGECIYAIGLLVRTLCAWLMGNPEFSLSLQEVAFRLGHEQSLNTFLLSRVDLFLLWEVIVIAIGIRRLFNIGWIVSSFLSILTIELVPILIVLHVKNVI